MTFEVIPFDAPLGAEVRGLDIRGALGEDDRKALLDAWHRHLVLLIRGQRLSDPQLIEVARNFGDLALASSNEVSGKFGGDLEGYPEITVISNIIENDRPIGGLGNGEAAWHTDSSFLDRPQGGSLLHALEVPPSGGDTQFCNMYLAYETLPQGLKDRIAGRKILHNFAYVASGKLRKGFEETTDVTKAPGAHHPIVRIHPDTGRQALFLGRRLKSYVIGLPVEESEALLDELWAHGTQPRFVWTQEWRVNDLVVWDNRCTMHRRDSFDPATRRLMHRTQTRGEVPIPVRAAEAA